MLKFFKKLKRGFTLVELLVVMGILGVLAAGLIALINPADKVQQAGDAKAKSDMNQVLSGINAYAAANEGLYNATGTTVAWAGISAHLAGHLTAIPVAAGTRVYGASLPLNSATGVIYTTLTSRKYTGAAAPSYCTGATPQANWYWNTTNGRFCGYCTAAATYPGVATATCTFTD